MPCWLPLRAVLLALAVIATAVGCAGKQSASGAARIGMVTDVGGLGDRSFNDSAYAGLVRAKTDLHVDTTVLQSRSAADYQINLTVLANKEYDEIFAIGFLMARDVTEVSERYPQRHFSIIDAVVDQPNVTSVTFKEEEGSFLVGAVAALVGHSKKIGFVGGMDVPLIQKFEAGYRAGVKHVCSDCTVIAQYAGVTPEAFRNPGKGKELALNQYQQGVNIIYHASGSTGLGVFEAARQTGKFAIGVDADQFNEAPGRIVTSMVKGIDVAVYDMIKLVRDRRFTGGIYTFGLAQNGVGYVYDAHNRALIPDAVRARLERIRADIIAGTIAVPDAR